MADPIYNVWRRVRGPFSVPEACHRCRLNDWEVFDIDKAGCRTCGRFHRCCDGGDCLGMSESDHQACEITGCWIRTRNFQQGYTDSAMPTATDLLQMPKPWVEGDHIVHWLHTLIFSETARRCIEREIQRVTDKVLITILFRVFILSIYFKYLVRIFITQSTQHINTPFRPPPPSPGSPRPGSWTNETRIF